MDFFSSDHHFNHVNIMKFCPDTRGIFKDVKEMNQAIIRDHNSVVGHEDRVFFLGDLGMLGDQETRKTLSQMNGRKVLIYGNHDNKTLKYPHLHESFEWIGPYLRTRDTFTSDGVAQDVALFHYPIWEWDGMHRGVLHFHGHVHGKPTGVPGKILDVSLDSLARLRPEKRFAPISLDEAIELLKNKPVRQHH